MADKKTVTAKPNMKRPAPKKARAKKVASKAPQLKDLPRAPKIAQLETGNIVSAKHGELSTSIKLLKESFVLIWEHKEVLLGYGILYMVLNLVLVQGLSSTAHLINLKHSLQLTHSHGGFIGFSLYAYLLGETGSNVSPFAGIYQLALAIFVSLATIWSLRQTYAGYAIKIRDGFYRGMYPLIPFVLVMLMIALQLVPFLAGAALYSIIMANGLAVNAGEQMLFLILFFATVLISLYMLCSSLIALYVVTLPEMTPMSALRTARDLVAHRRWTIMRKIIFLPIALFVLASVVLVPTSLFITVIAPWVLALITAFSLVVLHTYMYKLYRELL